MHGIFDRLTYANVTATVALFVALGGASYAAIALPPNSVGPRQLRSGAVSPRALAFTLGSRGLTDDHVQDLAKGPCNAPHRPGEVLSVVCPRPADVGLAAPGREVRLIFKRPGDLLASGAIGLHYLGPPGDLATVHLSVIIDGRVTRATHVRLAGGEQLQSPIQAFAGLVAGEHRVGIVVGASYETYEGGDVLVSPVTLVASAAPSA
jgi:hypothetical protein